MRLKTIWIAWMAILLLACNQQYRIVEMSGTLVEMNSSFDTPSHGEVGALVQSYKTELDREMNEVIGRSARFMDYKRPESLLTNLTSDVMKAYGDEHLPGGADIGVMNVHGHRATLPEGTVTIGNLYEIYSFDNTITFLELKGSDLEKMFDAYARIGGAGISSNVKLIIGGRKVKSVTIDGQPIDKNKIYHIVTLDYLAEGNDNMSAFRDAVANVNTGITLRDVMIDWVKEQTRRGDEIESVLDGRIVVKN
ncbi:5'-nucleotidase C-terminal domain-containing protein [uncultured Proteiniphilum sp.]|uniref:5'-nucleotidase C-terminal domain-containing protein n=1 Tax=uncultured Proteiniphilum sp. TaxID=497637 RepID=UPI002633DEBE|nr:5'-nucleotidase C-terminal domain-containing protein [uncultured Proteiniphilum sp.]